MMSVVICHSSRNQDFTDLKNFILQIPGVDLQCMAHESYANRRHGFQQAKYSNILFLDADVMLVSKKFFSELAIMLQRLSSEFVAFTGACTSSKKARWRERAYNHICNSWLGVDQGEDQEKKVSKCIGACFLISKNSILNSERAFPERWGGEELDLVKELGQSQTQILFSSNLLVEHRCNISFLGFAKRALQQGLHSPVLGFTAAKSKQISSLTSYVSKEPWLIPWIALHFFFVGLGVCLGVFWGRSSR